MFPLGPKIGLSITPKTFILISNSIHFFISLKKVLLPGLKLLKSHGWLVALIKPQFEVGKGLVGKGGVVRDPKLHEVVINDITKWMRFEIKMHLLGVIESPILGPSGNKEFLIVATKI